MKIVATSKIKIRIYLFVFLVSLLGSIAIGTGVVISKNTVDASADISNFKTVIIDAGHGGPDGGTSADDGTLEKDLNLQISLKLNDILKSMGIETVLTRDSDISIHDDSAKTIRQKKVSDIKNRLNIVNKSENSIFVSIHQNHFGDSKYSGTQIFYSKNNSLSRSLAESVRMPVVSHLQADNTREIKQIGTEVYLLYHATIPSIMVECGFLSNYEEANNLKNENYQQKLAFLIALGIVDYFNKTEDI